MARAPKRGGGTAAAGTKRGAGDLLAGGHVQAAVKASPFARATATPSAKLPAIKAPSIEGLTVVTPSPDPVGEDEITARFEDLLLQYAERRPRAVGQAVESGDAVTLDLVGFCDGRLLPFSVRQDVEVLAEPGGVLVGFGEALVGAKVGGRTTVEAALPTDHPVASLRGKKAAFAVEIKGAAAVVWPQPTDPAFLARAGPGRTLDETMQTIARQLMEEKAKAAVDVATNQVLESLAGRAEVAVPETLIDDEIGRAWADMEGRFLAENGFSREHQEQAVAAWLGDPGLRSDARRRLAIALTLRAVAERDGVRVGPDDMREFLEGYAEEMGIVPAELERSLASDPAARARLSDKVLHLRTVAHVMALAEVLPPKA